MSATETKPLPAAVVPGAPPVADLKPLPAPVDVSFDGGRIHLDLHKNRLDVAAAEADGRALVRTALDAARAGLAAGDTAKRVQLLRGRLAEAKDAEARARAAVAGAEQQHQAAAVDGDPVKAWAAVTKAKQALDGATAGAGALAAALAQAEAAASQEQRTRLADVVADLRRQIADRRDKATQGLMAAVKTPLEQLVGVSVAAVELSMALPAQGRLPT